jgi:hypothetical protein
MQERGSVSECDERVLREFYNQVLQLLASHIFLVLEQGRQRQEDLRKWPWVTALTGRALKLLHA